MAQKETLNTTCKFNNWFAITQGIASTVLPGWHRGFLVRPETDTWPQECPQWPSQPQRLNWDPVLKNTNLEMQKGSNPKFLPICQSEHHRPSTRAALGRSGPAVSFDSKQCTKSPPWHGLLSQLRGCYMWRWCPEGTFDPEEMLQCKKTPLHCRPLPQFWKSWLHQPGSRCSLLFHSSAPFSVLPSRWALPSSLIGCVGVFLCSC